MAFILWRPDDERGPTAAWYSDKLMLFAKVGMSIASCNQGHWYGVRYEIVKKRIDKGRWKYSDERVTQPGWIAIIYSLEQEVAEYLRYIDFLQASGTLKEGVGQLEVEELPSVSGLKALRVEVNLLDQMTK